MSYCIVETLCHLIDEPDEEGFLEIASLSHEGNHDSDDVSRTEKFTCMIIGCSALIACNQWYREETDTSGSTVYKLSGMCNLGNETILLKVSSQDS